MKLKLGRLGISLTGIVILLLVLVIGSPGVTLAEKPYYQGKTISLITTGSPGGGTDLTTRLLASILPKYLPGKPRIVVRSRPGGGGSLALNPFYVKAKPDGLTLLLTGSGAIGLQFTKAKVVRYDLNKMRHIGHVSSGGALVVISNDGLNRLKNPSAKPVVCGSKGGTEAWAYLPMFGKEFIGWNMTWILGFKGVSDLALAFRRGEIDMFGDSRSIKELEEEDAGKGLAQIGILKQGKFTRRSDFTHVPTMEELFEKEGKKPTGVARKAYIAVVAPLSIYKLFAAPPGTPDHIVNALIDAYEKTGKDPKFINTWNKLVSPVCAVGTGKETSDILASALDVDPAVLAYVNDLKRRLGIIK